MEGGVVTAVTVVMADTADTAMDIGVDTIPTMAHIGDTPATDTVMAGLLTDSGTTVTGK